MSDISNLEFSPAVFDPNKEQLHAIAAEVAQITADPAKMTKEDFELVNATKNKLVKARTAIQKRGKEVREQAVKFQRDVIAYEKDLIAIIEPEEQRLKEIEAAAKEYAMQEERKKTLPEFRAKLDTIGDGVEVDDAFLLSLDPNGRDAYYNERLGAKLEADRVAADAKRAEEDAARAAEDKRLQDEREKIEAEKRLAAERSHNLRVQRMLAIGFRKVGSAFQYDQISVLEAEIVGIDDEAFNKLVDESSDAIQKLASELRAREEEKRQEEIKQAQEAAKEEERKRLEKEEAERKEAAEREAAQKAAEEAERSRAEAYQKWLADNSYNPETDYIGKGEAVDVLYRKVSAYQHPTA